MGLQFPSKGNVMRKYVPIAICTIAAVAFGIWVVYDHNWKLGTVQAIWLVVLIAGEAAAWATATGKGYRG